LIIQQFLNNNKLVLLLDIDNTILHASSVDLSKTEYEELKKQYKDEIGIVKLNNQRLVFKLRPFLRELFESIKDKYQIYLYTYGTMDYAIEIINYINKTFEYNYLSVDRLVARDNNETFNGKSIKRVFPTQEDMILILDDRRDVWGEETKNLINLTRYFFFKDRDFSINSNYLPADTDRTLYSVENILTFVHAAFFHIYRNKGIIMDVENILEKKLNSIFSGRNFVLSGMGSKKLLSKTIQNYIIDTLGGNLLTDYEPEVDIVIAEKYEGRY
jgi:FCP1-like phosphatase family protein